VYHDHENSKFCIKLDDESKTQAIFYVKWLEAKDLFSVNLKM
jgi:hypothetical protein